MTAFPTSSHPNNHPPSRLPSSGPTRSGSTSASRGPGSSARGRTDGNRHLGTAAAGQQLSTALPMIGAGESRRLLRTPCRARTRLDPCGRSLSSGAARLSQEPLPDTGRVPPLAVSRRFSQPGGAPPQRRRTARFRRRTDGAGGGAPAPPSPDRPASPSLKLFRPYMLAGV